MNNQERQQRRYVAQMAERLRRGLMDRRDFIRAAGMAGFGFANARYLGGGGASSAVAQEAAATVQVADEATGSTAAQQSFLKEVGGRFRGTRIRVISENTPAGIVIRNSKHAPNHDAAWIFMQRATSAEVAARANAMGADTPTRASCYSDPLILEKRASKAGTTRHFEVTRRAIETRMGTAPHMTAWPDLAIRVNASELGKLTNAPWGSPPASV
jgi:hypothetical protein